MDILNLSENKSSQIKRVWQKIKRFANFLKSAKKYKFPLKWDFLEFLLKISLRKKFAN